MPEFKSEEISLDPGDDQFIDLAKRIEGRLTEWQSDLETRESKLKPAADDLEARSQQAAASTLEAVAARYVAQTRQHGAFGLPGYTNPAPSAPAPDPGKPPAVASPAPPVPGSLADVAARWQASQKSYGAMGLSAKS